MTTLPQTTPVRVPQSAGAGLPTVHLPGAGGPTAPAPFQMTGADIRRVLRANLWLIIIFLVLSAIVGYALNLWLLRNYPRFTATGLLRIDPSQLTDPLKEKFNDISDSRLITELRTQAQLLTTDRLFAEVLKKDSRLRETTWFADFVYTDPKSGERRIDTKAAKEDLGKSFRATPVPDSTLLSISFTYAVPADCKTIVDEIVREHLEQERAKAEVRFAGQTKILQSMQDALQRQLSQLAARVYDQQAQLAKQGAPPGPNMLSAREAELKVLLEQKLKLREDAGQLNSMYLSIKDKVLKGGTISKVEQEIEQDPSVYNMARELSFMQIRRDVQEATLGSSHKDVVTLTKQVDATDKKLEECRSKLRAQIQDQFIQKLAVEAESTTVQYQEVSKEVDDLRNKLADLGKEMSLLQAQKDDEKALREELQEVSSKLRDMTVARSPASQARIDWASTTEVPELPSFPKLGFTLPLCVFFGLALALGIAFLREIMDDTVRSPRDVARVGQMNLLGIIADENDDPQAADAALPIFDAPHSLTAEQFRQVRTRLQHAASLDTTRSIMVTGPSPLDGKTTVASNLAAGLALNGRKILLVDANFRRPEIHRLLGGTNDKGFSDVLNGTVALEEAAQTTRIPNLFILPSGPKPANATELFESQLLIDFLDRALEEYDHVIFDTGPFLVVAEAAALAARVDGVVTVIRAHAESRGLLQRMRDALRQVKAEHIGVVLNAVRAQGGGYYRRNIKTFYDYQSVE